RRRSRTDEVEDAVRRRLLDSYDVGAGALDVERAVDGDFALRQDNGGAYQARVKRHQVVRGQRPADGVAQRTGGTVQRDGHQRRCPAFLQVLNLELDPLREGD